MWPVCRPKEVDQLREAIEELYYFDFVLDDIPTWGFVGYMVERGFLPHSHKEGGAVDTPGLQHRVQRRLCDLCQRFSEGLQASAPGGRWRWCQTRGGGDRRPSPTACTGLIAL
uniref:Uncharacterized protein n=1 Tax=Hucho hucho TaxID=62062 RepID=A0A4W5K562_9TELE